jgi:hypothetical protein
LSEIAPCAHTTVKELRAYLYAYSETTGDDTGGDALVGLFNFSRKIITDPNGQEAFLRGLGVSPKDEHNKWRDSVTLLIESIQKTGSETPPEGPGEE